MVWKQTPKLTKKHMVFLLLLLCGIVHHSHGRTYESENITINGSTDALAGIAAPPSNIQPECDLCINTDGDPDGDPYDYLSLVLQWPKSFCSTRPLGTKGCTGQIPNYFTVHGLWPQLTNSPCTHCDTDIDLNEDQLEALESITYEPWYSDMSKYWPNLINRSDDHEFWKHEYHKHGSCFVQFRTQPLSYFHETVKAANNYTSLTDLLLRGKIRLPQGRYYLVDIEKIIFKKFGLIPRLRCKNARDANGISIILLYEIELCFETNWTLRNCNDKFREFGCSNCGNQLPDQLVVTLQQPDQLATPPYSGGATPPYSGGTSGGATPPYSGGTSGGATPPYSGGTIGGATPPYSGGTIGGATPLYSGGTTPPYSGGTTLYLGWAVAQLRLAFLFFVLPIYMF